MVACGSFIEQFEFERFVAAYRHYRLEKELTSQMWKINFSDLSFHFKQEPSSPQPRQTAVSVFMSLDLGI